MSRLRPLYSIASDVFFGAYSEDARRQCCDLATRAANGEPHVDNLVWEVLLADGDPKPDFELSRAFIKLLVGLSYGFKGWLSNQDPDLYAAAPAQELVSYSPIEEFRDWRSQWLASGGKFVCSRMIALKGDPVWRNLSAFSLPWPPFEVGSLADVEDILFPEARRLGLVQHRPVSPRSAWCLDNAALATFKNGLITSLDHWETARL